MGSDIRNRSGYGCGSGCLTLIVVGAGLSLLVEGWQEASERVRAVLIFGTIALLCLGIYAWDRQKGVRAAKEKEAREGAKGKWRGR